MTSNPSEGRSAAGEGPAGRIMSWMAQQPVECYLVGGSVRDQLLGRPVCDLDFALSGDALATARRLANAFQGDFYPLDEERGTGRAILGGDGGGRLVVDLARLRGADLATDLADRDFSVNALARDVHSPEVLIDFHGGLTDLQDRLIRPIHDASILNDPVRAIRAVRFSAELRFSLAPETEAAIRRDAPGIVSVSGERLRDEMVRLLVLPSAGSFLFLLDRLGLLTLLFPELEPLRDLPQPPPHELSGLSHSIETVIALESLVDEDAGGLTPVLKEFSGRNRAHLLEPASDNRSRLVTLKLAGLLHDTGKPASQSRGESGRPRYLGHEQLGSLQAEQAMRRLRMNNSEVRLARTIVSHHMRPLLLSMEREVTRRAVYRFFRDTGRAGVEVILHSLADDLAKSGRDHRAGLSERLVAVAQRLLEDYWDRPDLRVNPPPLLDGHDLQRLLSLRPGPRLGELLELVREAQASGEVQTRQQALDLIAQVEQSGT